MNSGQRAVLLVFVVVAVGMMLYPPFHIVSQGTEMNMGYGFLFDPPKKGYLVASANVGVLLAQWVVAILVAAVAWLLTRTNGSSMPRMPRERSVENKGLVVGISFLFLRLLRAIAGIVFAWQVIGILPVATWVFENSAISEGMVAMLLLKAAILGIAGVTFFGTRKYIHWLHIRWYGTPHPALTKAMAL